MMMVSSDYIKPLRSGERTRVLISYATAPGRGREPGVGWAFLKTYAELCHARGQRLVAVIRGRDLEACREGLRELDLLDDVLLLAPEVSARLSWLSGLGGARVGYLLWRPLAIRQIRQATRFASVSTVHQVTWASFLLPSASPRKLRKAFIWGPATVSRRLSEGNLLRSRLLQGVINVVSRRNSSRAALLLCNNKFTSKILSGRGRPRTAVEPNVLLAPASPVRRKNKENAVIVGRLIPLKRPLLAVKALLDPRLSNVHLDIIGDGPLHDSLQAFCKDSRLEQRVTFHGWLERDQVLTHVKGARLLIHPAEREGAGWVVGEAASLGVPAVVFENTGAATVVELSDNGGVICLETDDPVKALADGIVEALSKEIPQPTDRWSIDRLPGLLESWWQEVEKRG